MPSSFKAVTQRVCALLSISNVPDCYFMKVKVKVKSFSHVRLFATRGLQPTKLLHPWDSPGKNTGVGCHFLVQGIFPTQRSNPGLPHCRQTHGKQMGKMWKLPDFIFLGSKITVDSDCSHEIKTHLLSGRKAMTNPDSILKSRDITLPTKIHIVVYPLVMYRCESWTIKKDEH